MWALPAAFACERFDHLGEVARETGHVEQAAVLAALRQRGARGLHCSRVVAELDGGSHERRVVGHVERVHAQVVVEAAGHA